MPPKNGNKGLIPWEAEMRADAAVAKGMEDSTATGQFFSVKGGILKWNDAPLPKNQMGVVILDGILENKFYEGEYDSENPQPPACFAFGRDEATMKPHKDVMDAGTAQSEACKGCAKNEWGTADKGRGKACKNIRRLALLVAGEFDAQDRFIPKTNAQHFETSSIGFMLLPVTSVKGYSAVVKQITATLNKPPYAVFMKVNVVPDSKSQFKVVFQAISEIPDSLMPTIMKRVKEARGVIEMPYQKAEEQAAKPPVKGNKKKY